MPVYDVLHPGMSESEQLTAIHQLHALPCTPVPLLLKSSRQDGKGVYVCAKLAAADSLMAARLLTVLVTKENRNSLPLLRMPLSLLKIKQMCWLCTYLEGYSPC